MNWKAKDSRKFAILYPNKLPLGYLYHNFPKLLHWSIAYIINVGEYQNAPQFWTFLFNLKAPNGHLSLYLLHSHLSSSSWVFPLLLIFCISRVEDEGLEVFFVVDLQQVSNIYLWTIRVTASKYFGPNLCSWNGSGQRFFVQIYLIKCVGLCFQRVMLCVFVLS